MIFFTPYAGLSGSEMALMSILTEFEKTQNSITVVSNYKSKYVNKKLKKVEYYSYQSFLENRNLGKKIHHRLFFPGERLYQKFLKKIYVPNEIWYVNTIMMPDVVEFAEKNGVEIILHIHEQYSVYRNLTDSQVKRLITYPKLIIAASECSAAVLRKIGCVLPVKISYPGIDLSVLNNRDSQLLRERLKIDQKSFIWGSVGNLDENKNPVLFIEIAREYIRKFPETYFVWIGGSHSGWLFNYCQNLIRYYDLTDKVFFLAHESVSYHDMISGFQGYITTSLLESFGITTLEALRLGLPIVAYDSEGVREVLSTNQLGVVTKSTDPEVFVNLMREALSNSDKVYNAKVQAAEKFDIKITYIKWLECIQSL